MNIPKFSVRYPVTVTMIMLAIGILGIISFNRLGTDLLPSIYNPRIVVELRSGERSPQDIEQRFARNLEGSLATISNVVEVRSVCSLGKVVTTATFGWGTDMDFALLDVQKKVATYESDPEVNTVTVARFDPQEEPVIVMAMSAAVQSGFDLDELRRVAETVVKRNLERLEGVARVRVFGGIKREVRVELNDYLLSAYNLTPADIINKIKNSNANAAGGKIVENNKAYIIKGIGKYTQIDEIAATVIGYRTATNGSDSTISGQQQSANAYAPDRVPVYLSDLASIQYAPEERSDRVLLNSQEGIGLYIFKESGGNSVQVADEILAEISDMKKELADVEFTLVRSQASFINNSIGEVKTTAIFGIVLAVLVLYAFLRNFGATFIISLAIPISILATFTLMYFQNLTLNIMTLGGLALGAGMLVDNAIVVIENIFRRRQLGEEASQAAIAGTAEVGVAVVASTLTTVIVFLPIVYVEGVAAELFREQAWVVAFSLLSSLLVAFMLIPMLAARFFAKKEAIRQQTLRIPLYEKALSWALTHRSVVVVVALLMLIVSAVLLPIVGSEFVPRSTENEIAITLELPPGTPLERTESVVDAVEKRINAVLKDKLGLIYSTINVQASQNLLFAGSKESEHLAQITLTLNRDTNDALTPQQAIRTLQPHMDFPGIATTLRIRESSLQQTIGTTSAPVVIEIRGADLEKLQSLSKTIAAEIQQIEDLHTIEISFQKGLPEYALKVDRLLSANLGIDLQQIGDAVRKRLTGTVATDFHTEGNERDIRVVFPELSKPELENLPLQTGSGSQIRLKDIAELIPREGPLEIHRRNQFRIGYVTANLQKNIKLSNAVKKVNRVISDISLPEGYQVRFAGEEASREDSFSQLQFALLLSVILVYMVLASLFESLLHPFTIMLTLPLAGVGVVFAFLIVGEPLSVMALIGIIMLAGIAANDSIVLVDYIHRLRAAGMARREAVVQAGRDRLRPIVITSATTILALLPLAIGFGEGAKLRAPMAIAVIGGLITSTLLTLVVIPVVYELIDGLAFKKKFELNQ